MIPIRGYAGFDTLKHIWIGAMFTDEQIMGTPALQSNPQVSEPLLRIASETREDLQQLRHILESHGVTVHQSQPQGQFDIGMKPPINVRDDFAVIGDHIHTATWTMKPYADLISSVDRSALKIRTLPRGVSPTTANVIRLGRDLYWDVAPTWLQSDINHYTQLWSRQGFAVHLSHRGYHSDSAFHVVKPGVIVSMEDVQDYDQLFPGWQVLYIGDEPSYSLESSELIRSFRELKQRNGGRWWLIGEEHNHTFTEFVNTTLQSWTGYMEETKFDVNMLSIDQSTVIVNCYNKRIFDFLASHGVEPILFEFRHRYFFDGGVHCVTQDLYREGEQISYL